MWLNWEPTGCLYPIDCFIFPGAEGKQCHEEMQLRGWHAPSFVCSVWQGALDGDWEAMRSAMRKGLLLEREVSVQQRLLPQSAVVATSWISGAAAAIHHSLVCWARKRLAQRWQWLCLVTQNYCKCIHSECTCALAGGRTLWALCISGFHIWCTLCPWEVAEVFA